jgi:hypothetical protein
MSGVNIALPHLIVQSLLFYLILLHAYVDDSGEPFVKSFKILPHALRYTSCNKLIIACFMFSSINSVDEEESKQSFTV